MDENPISPRFQKNKLLAVVSVSVTVSAFLTGGSVYAYQYKQQVTKTQELQTQIDSLKAQLTSETITIPFSTPSPRTTATPVQSNTPTPSSALTLKTLTWNPREGFNPEKVTTDIHLSVQYPSTCTTIAFAPADLTLKTSSPTPAEVDCVIEGKKSTLRFTNPYTIQDPNDKTHVINSTNNDYGKAHLILQSETPFTTPNGTYTKAIISSRDDVSKDWEVDYYFKGDNYVTQKTRVELEATGYVPANASSAQLKVLDDIMQTLSCSGSGCPQ